MNSVVSAMSDSPKGGKPRRIEVLCVPRYLLSRGLTRVCFCGVNLQIYHR